MAKVHVLETQGNLTRVIFHISVPVTNNSVGTPWANVLINSGVGGQTVLKDGNGSGGTIDNTEKSAIIAGTIFEAEDRVVIPNGMNAAQANVFFDNLHAAKTIEIQQQIVARLNLFGYIRA